MIFLGHVGNVFHEPVIRHQGWWSIDLGCRAGKFGKMPAMSVLESSFRFFRRFLFGNVLFRGAFYFDLFCS